MSKPGITLYMHVHQPPRVRQYSIFDTARDHNYFVDNALSQQNNEQIFRKVAEKSYRPMNKLLKSLLDAHPEFKFSLSITGTFIEQCEAWAPDVLDSFRELTQTGRVEILAETYYHSLAFFYSRAEFGRQVAAHRAKIKQVFGLDTKVFRNTELAYNDDLGKWVDEFGFKGVVAEGWDPILEWRSPNKVYKPPQTKNTSLLLKNYKLSDDLAFRFGDKGWSEYPLSVEKYTSWIDASLEEGQTLNLFMDYETFGEHQWEDTGIFDFFGGLISQWASRQDRTFYTTSGAIEAFEPVAGLSMPQTVTWADTERDLTAWLGNSMQHEAVRHLYSLEADILRSDNVELIADWRKLQTSDHFYYMCTKWFNDGDVHAYFSPYDSPYEAFLYYMNTIRDLRWRLYHYHSTGALDG